MGVPKPQSLGTRKRIIDAMTNSTHGQIRISFAQLPNYWERTVEEYSSAAEVLQRLDELQRQCLHGKGKAIGVNVEKSDDDVMTVGLAGDQWLLIHTLEVDEQYFSVGDDTASGETLFVIPEGVEFANKHLLPASRGKETLKRWLDDGIEHTGSEWTERMF
jgi:hypothetical protein